MIAGTGEDACHLCGRCGNIFLDMLCDNVDTVAKECVGSQLARRSGCFVFRLRSSLCGSSYAAVTNWGRHGGLHWRSGRCGSCNVVKVCANVYRASVGVLPNEARWSRRSGALLSCSLCENAYGIANVGAAGICGDERRRFGTSSGDRLCGSGGPSRSTNTGQEGRERGGGADGGGAAWKEECSGSGEEAGTIKGRNTATIELDAIILHHTREYHTSYIIWNWNKLRRRFAPRGPDRLPDAGSLSRGGRRHLMIIYVGGVVTVTFITIIIDDFVDDFTSEWCGEYGAAVGIACGTKSWNTSGTKAYIRIGEATNPGPEHVDDDGGWVRDGAVRYRDPGQDGFRYARQSPTKEAGTDPIADGHFSMVIDTVNGTTWNSAKRYLRSTVADVVLIQEHHLGPAAIPAAKAWALRMGWQPIIEPAIEGEGDGWKGGVGIPARRHIGVSPPRVGQQELVKA